MHRYSCHGNLFFFLVNSWAPTSRYKDSNDKLGRYLKSGLLDPEREKSLKDKLNKDEV